ncbi:ParB/RepB/Spo0J family partition protein [Pseudogemmobacter sp. W21_MBD1_M6]|uniref:ParB/RepB/Spo0J family partition protein n=1 Tax=Pseudogemmobacter sp. W21_MBD1_M6 TaxID=3240271 RepID=UPI003F992CF6
MSKRRIFDIDFPENGAVPAGTDQTPDPKPETEMRRGPMASAINENAGALRERETAERAIREENDRLAHELVRLKKQGLIVDLIPVDDIRTVKLTRDRSTGRDPDLEELKVSIQAIGLSNAIQVELTDDGYELVQGFRRLSAYRALFAETGEERYAKIPAGLIAKGEAMEALYRRMVDENLVRRDISFAEMAQLALSYAKDPETSSATIEEAIAALYASANRQKRIYIRHFATMLEGIGSHVKFPESIPRALGLQLEKRISNESGAAATIRHALAAAMATTPEAEVDVLRAQAVKENVAKPAAPTPTSVAKTTFRHAVPAGTVRCAARNGKLELAMDRDFSNEDRVRLEAAITAFFKELDG